MPSEPPKVTARSRDSDEAPGAPADAVAGRPPRSAGRRPASRRLLVTRIVFYGGVVALGGWMLTSVAFHLLREHGPLASPKRISARADDSREIFQCYFDTLLLFNIMLADYGQIPSESRCKSVSIRSEWNHVYAWDTHPWYVVHKGGKSSADDLGAWRYHRYVVWSRCRLNDDDVLQRSPALAQLATVHQQMDELRRLLTDHLQRFVESSSPVVKSIRQRLDRTYEILNRPERWMKRQKNLARYRLRKWGIRDREPAACPIGF